MRCRNLGRSAFRALRASPAARSGPVVVSWLPLPGCQPPLVAFAIPKRAGKAVVRNRLRRQLKEAVRRYMDLPAGAYLVRAKPQATVLEFQALRAHLELAAVAAAHLRPRAKLASGAKLSHSAPAACIKGSRQLEDPEISVQASPELTRAWPHL